MAVLSRLALKSFNKLNVANNVIGTFRYACRSKVWNNVPVRNCHERTFMVRNSRFEYKKFKDMLHLYMFVGIVPLALIIIYSHIFIGPATLALIPEGYDPKPWEYYRHPITRFFAKYIVNCPHEIHERNMHNAFIDHEKKELKLLRKKIMDLIKKRQDYQAWYFDKAVVKYVRKAREENENVANKKSTTIGWII